MPPSISLDPKRELSNRPFLPITPIPVTSPIRSGSDIPRPLPLRSSEKHTTIDGSCLYADFFPTRLQIVWTECGATIRRFCERQAVPIYTFGIWRTPSGTGNSKQITSFVPGRRSSGGDLVSRRPLQRRTNANTGTFSSSAIFANSISSHSAFPFSILFYTNVGSVSFNVLTMDVAQVVMVPNRDNRR